MTFFVALAAFSLVFFGLWLLLQNRLNGHQKRISTLETDVEEVKEGVIKFVGYDPFDIRAKK